MTKEEKTEYNKRYYADNKESENARNRAYRETHREERKISHRLWREGSIVEKKLMTNFLIEKYAGIPCVDCERAYPWECMDFDHRPNETKSFGVSRKQNALITPERIAEVMKEIDKCDLVCSNCHRIRTKSRYRSPHGHS